MTAPTSLLRRLLAPWRETPARMAILEAQVAADTEMIARLNAATSKVAAKLTALLDKVAQLDSDAAADAQADAEALRPAVEFLENLGVDGQDPVPSEDPVPSDPTPVDGGDIVPPDNDEPTA